MELRTFLNDGEHYDAAHVSLLDEQYWVQSAHQIGGEVLELACGTGRLSLPIAQAGLHVTGIDTSEAFLARARQKAAGRHLGVRFERADVRSFALPIVFRFVAFPFRSVAVLLTDRDLNACFACVRQHVDRGGVFVLDAFNPSPSGFVPSPAKVRYQSPDGKGLVEVDHERRYDPKSHIATSVFTFLCPASTERVSEELRLRLYTAEQLVTALHSNGFQLMEHLGGYDGRAYTNDAPFQLLIAQAV